jgi:hypothetical protein
MSVLHARASCPCLHAACLKITEVRKSNFEGPQLDIHKLFFWSALPQAIRTVCRQYCASAEAQMATFGKYVSLWFPRGDIKWSVLDILYIRGWLTR